MNSNPDIALAQKIAQSGVEQMKHSDTNKEGMGGGSVNARNILLMVSRGPCSNCLNLRATRHGNDGKSHIYCNGDSGRFARLCSELTYSLPFEIVCPDQQIIK